MKLIIIVLLSLGSLSTYAKFIGGIGYTQPAEYRVDNEINPSPLGTNVIPMIIYRGERLSVMGPNISYSLIKGAISFGVNISATGDRYRAEGLDQRDAAINGGFSLRLLFLTLNYGADITNVYQGNMGNASIGWRFELTDKLFFSPSIGKQFLNMAYVNYYYGVKEDEVTEDFDFYETKGATNDVYKVGLTYVVNPVHSFTANYSYKKFDKVIADSPTISKDSYGTTSFFWNYNF